MKSICFLIYTSTLLVFGLTGCHSDKSSDNPDSPDQLGIRNSSLTYNQIKIPESLTSQAPLFLISGIQKIQDITPM